GKGIFVWTVSAPVVLLTLIKVPNGIGSALFIARMIPSFGSYASSSARLGSPVFVWTSPTVLPFLTSIVTTRLLPSVTKSHGKWATTPLGQTQLPPPAAPLPPGIALQSAADTNPANGGLAESCVTNAAWLASTTSTTLLERSAR